MSWDDGDWRCPNCDSRYCTGSCRYTETARYFVGYGWCEDHEIPEPRLGYVWTERWDGSFVQQQDRLQKTLPFIRTRHERNQDA